MNKVALYKKFYKLGSHIDNMCFRYIQYGLVESAVHDLWDIIKSGKFTDVQKFTEKFYKIKRTLEARIRVYVGNINSTEFKDTKLITKLQIKHEFNKLKAAHLDLSRFEQDFLTVLGILLFDVNTMNQFQNKEPKMPEE